MKIIALIPPSYDFLCTTIVEGLNELGHNVITNIRGNGSFNISKNLIKDSKKANLILLFSSRDYKKRKRFVIENSLESKTFYIDGSDFFFLEDISAIFYFKIIFKREIFIKKDIMPSNLSVSSIKKFIFDKIKGIPHSILADEKKMIPLPFAAEKEYFHCEGTKKTIDVSCMLRPNKPGRRKINNTIKKMKIKSVVGPVTSGSFEESKSKIKEKYYKILAKSKISISYPGAGFDTGRFWEILSNKCLLFSPKIKIKMPHTFIEFKHFVPYETTEELRKRIYYFLKNPKKAEEIRNAGFEHLMRHHTTKKRAEYLLHEIKKRGNIKID